VKQRLSFLEGSIIKIDRSVWGPRRCMAVFLTLTSSETSGIDFLLGRMSGMLSMLL